MPSGMALRPDRGTPYHDVFAGGRVIELHLNHRAAGDTVYPRLREIERIRIINRQGFGEIVKHLRLGFSQAC